MTWMALLGLCERRSVAEAGLLTVEAEDRPQR